MRPFADAYVAEYNMAPEVNSYLVHDAVLMLVDALERAGSLEGPMLKAALETCDIQGLTGRISIGKDTHDPEGKDAAILKIVGPRIVFVEKFAAP